VQAQKVKTKSTNSRSSVKETHNGLPSRVTSNGLVDSSAADIAGSTEQGASAPGKARKKSKSSKCNKTSQPTAADLHGKMDTPSEREVI